MPDTTPVRTPGPYPPFSDYDRPGFRRPVTVPQWTRPGPPGRRPTGPYRRPKPPFKPIPIFTPENTRPEEDEDILTLDLGAQLQPAHAAEETINQAQGEEDAKPVMEETTTTSTTTTTEKTDIDVAEISNYEKNKEKSSLKMEKHTSKPAVEETPTPQPTPTSSTISPTQVLRLDDPVTNSTTSIASASVALESMTPTIESSIQEVLQTLKDVVMDTPKLSTTATPSLTNVSSSAVGSVERVNISSTTTSTSSGNRH